MDLTKILDQYARGVLSEADDSTLLAVQQRINQTAKHMRDSGLQTATMLVNVDGQPNDAHVELSLLTKISESISQWLGKRYGCND